MFFMFRYCNTTRKSNMFYSLLKIQLFSKYYIFLFNSVNSGNFTFSLPRYFLFLNYPMNILGWQQTNEDFSDR